MNHCNSKLIGARSKIAVCVTAALLLLHMNDAVLGFTPLEPITNKSNRVVTAKSTATETTAKSTATTRHSSLLSSEVNAEELLASSTFAIKPDDLILRAKELLSEDVGLGTKDGGECLADDFVFRAAFVEVKKEGYLNALGSFRLEDSFDIQSNFFGFTVDPLQTNRVWFFSRPISKQIGAFMGVEPPTDDDKDLILPPECLHLDFDDKGFITEFGFYTVDRAQGNTGGLGGAFGYFYGVGKPLPFPEGKPYKPSFRYRMLQKFGSFFERFQKK